MYYKICVNIINMLIDYLYLILIIILIISIIYLLHISYSYRNSYNNSSIEKFVNPMLVDYKDNNPNIIKNLNGYLNNYTEIIDNIRNRQTINDNLEYNKLNNQIVKNMENKKGLLNMKNELEPMPETFPIDKLIKTIKSNYNSQSLSLFSNDINKYGVLANDKCLTVNGLCKDEFCLLNCQNNLYASDSQKFYTDRIYSADDIVRLTKMPKHKVSDANVYPFNIFRSKVNDKCLSMYNEGINVEKCDLNLLNQQWAISPDENICLLN